jgi:hypothetical protein
MLDEFEDKYSDFLDYHNIGGKWVHKDVWQTSHKDYFF